MWANILQMKSNAHCQVSQSDPTFSKPAEERRRGGEEERRRGGEEERRRGHISIHSILCHPPAGINLSELTCPAFPLELHLTASLHDYWASILAEHSTDIKDTWPLSHAKTLSALLHHNVEEKTERKKLQRGREGGGTSERWNVMFGGVREEERVETPREWGDGGSEWGCTAEELQGLELISNWLLCYQEA